MVDIRIEDRQLVVEPRGWHKLWSFNGTIRVPLRKVKEVHRRYDEVKGLFPGIRMPGTHLPGVITSGTYYKGGSKDFWSVMNLKKAVIIELEGHSFNKLIVEVQDPDAAIKLFTDAMNSVS